MAQQIEQGFAQLSIPSKPIRTAYFIWQDPYMVAAGDTFIDDMLTRFGGLNVFGDKKRYPIINLADLQAAQPEQILLSSEPYPFKTKHIAAFQEACPQAEVRLVDGTLYSWYGSRLLKSLSEIRKIR
jgi:ABC-type Fe3+-hydroxamate transport system substrate-binding protein